MISGFRQEQAAGQTPPPMPAALELPSIHTVRGTKVVLDGDLARLYGVPTKRLLEQMRRNADRFPPDFCFQLENEEMAALRSQIATSKRGRGGRRYAPWGFTEHGALMAANVLNSSRGVRMSIFIVRAFLRVREELASGAGILKRLAAIDRKLLVHDVVLCDIYRKLQPLLLPPLGRPKREIGFHVKPQELELAKRLRCGGGEAGARILEPHRRDDPAGRLS